MPARSSGPGCRTPRTTGAARIAPCSSSGGRTPTGSTPSGSRASRTTATATSCAIGSGAWDAQGRPSWVDIEQIYSVHADGMRREASALDLERFVRVADALHQRYGWAVGERDAYSRRGGRYQTRTDDLFRVKEARYQLRQSPVALRGRVLDPTGCPRAGTNRRRVTRAGRAGFALRRSSAKVVQAPGAIREHADVAQLVAHNLAKVGVASSSLVIRSSAGVSSRGDHGTWGQTTRVAWPSG